MTEDHRTYYAEGADAMFDQITAIVVHERARAFTPHVGQEVLVRVDDPDRYPSLAPVASHVTRLAMVASAGDGAMLTFADPLTIPKAPRMPRFTVCDMYGNAIGVT